MLIRLAASLRYGIRPLPHHEDTNVSDASDGGVVTRHPPADDEVSGHGPKLVRTGRALLLIERFSTDEFDGDYIP